jgi:hypothetical protein
MKDEDDRSSDDIVLISLDQMSSKAETNLGPHFECVIVKLVMWIPNQHYLNVISPILFVACGI